MRRKDVTHIRWEKKNENYLFIKVASYFENWVFSRWTFLCVNRRDRLNFVLFFLIFFWIITKQCKNKGPNVAIDLITNSVSPMPDKLALWHTNFLQLFHRQYFMAVYHDYFHVFLAIQTSLWHDISGNINLKKLFVPGKLMRFWLTLLNGWPYYRPRKLFFLFPLCFRFRFSCLCVCVCFFFFL